MLRRFFLSAALVMAGWATSVQANDADVAAIQAEITKNHDRAIARLQEWIRHPAIAAEDHGFPDGAERMAALLREVGFQQTEIVATDGKPGVFATLDASAEKTVGMYFMYDVKQFDPAEWTSPPLEAAIIDRPGVGKVMIGRGAVNQKGPESAFLAAIDAFRTAGKKLPVNIVLIAEGEEEIGSPHIAQLVLKPHVKEALAKCIGVWMPHATQGLDGAVTVNLGAKGVVEVELTASGAKWGRGPMRDVHSSFKSMVDSPVWRLVQALDTLVTEDGNTVAIDGWFENVRPLLPEEKAMIAEASRKLTERQFKVGAATTKWIDDLPFLAALERYVSQPTANIEGIYGGYTGPGGKTVLPHKASAKLDFRLVPNQTAEEAVTKLKAHLAKRGFGDIDVNFTGGYGPTATKADEPMIQKQLAVLKRSGVEAVLWPRLAGSYPGFVFTDAPLNLAAGHFGLGHGGGAHAPDEFFVIESANPKVRGYDGMTLSFVEYLYELAK
ncbi:MAG: twin-arginine translocation pathway signal protein [Opitutus sp.]|nr:twin-arginine translocation pathway signal protein [Opitutus sp.]